MRDQMCKDCCSKVNAKVMRGFKIKVCSCCGKQKSFLFNSQTICKDCCKEKSICQQCGKLIEE